MGRLARIMGIVGCFAALGACGFEPMYAPGGLRNAHGTAADLAAVEVAKIRNDAGREFRVGQQLSNALEERLYATGVDKPRYRLQLRVTENSEGFGFRPDESVTRYGLRLRADYQLVEIATSRIVLDESTQTYNSYDVSQSDFATAMAERDMEDRLAKDLSDRIVSRLGRYFRAEATPETR
jgi:LPS-assembly lipoprotein